MLTRQVYASATVDSVHWVCSATVRRGSNGCAIVTDLFGFESSDEAGNVTGRFDELDEREFGEVLEALERDALESFWWPDDEPAHEWRANERAHWEAIQRDWTVN